MILIEEINNYGTILNYNHDKILIAKSCGKCSEVKELHEFHKTNNSTTGTVSSCKICIKKFQHDNYRKNTRLYFSSYTDQGDLLNRECSKCDVILPADEFYKHQKGKNGYSSYCKTCSCSHIKEYSINNSQIVKANRKKYYTNNTEKIKLNNSVKRYTQRKQKKFYTNFILEITQLYKTSMSINDISIDKVAVDHIIPLIHPNVCGLHYPENLKIIPHSENCSKGNKWDGTYENKNWETEWRKGRNLNKVLSND